MQNMSVKVRPFHLRHVILTQTKLSCYDICPVAPPAPPLFLYLFCLLEGCIRDGSIASSPSAKNRAALFPNPTMMLNGKEKGDSHPSYRDKIDF